MGLEAELAWFCMLGAKAALLELTVCVKSEEEGVTWPSTHSLIIYIIDNYGSLPT